MIILYHKGWKNFFVIQWRILLLLPSDFAFEMQKLGPDLAGNKSLAVFMDWLVVKSNDILRTTNPTRMN